MDNILGNIAAGLLEPLQLGEEALAELTDLVADGAELTAEAAAELAQRLAGWAQKVQALQDILQTRKLAQ